MLNNILLIMEHFDLKRKLGSVILLKFIKDNGEVDRLLSKKLKMILVLLVLKNNLEDKL